ncbi:hypothetical protein R1sor_005262 [Riccia sorocarpa]|uniref:Reverse transcriptase domain-containing protein n=1 Tax=Riccia sorocarpa TaxID=122646 RepID=A0ABD3HLA5_9MARC
MKFGARFLGYINAILNTASSCIIINGVRSNPVKVNRSVCQGCPLSPLLFIPVTESLTAAIEQIVQIGEVQGIYLQKANVHYCLGFFADDSHLIIRAEREGAFRLKNLLDSFVLATGLRIQWAKSTARWIGPQATQRPAWTENLEWSWKRASEETKLLGFTFEDQIKEEAMLRDCQHKVLNFCNNRQYEKLSITGRITVVNSILLGSFCFAARTIRWAFQPGYHPLQATIRGHVDAQSVAAFGIPGAHWAYMPARTKGEGMSKVLLNVFPTWERLKKHILHPQILTKLDWDQTQIWGTTRMAKDGKVQRVDSQAKRSLWEEGYRNLSHLTLGTEAELARWDTRRIQGSEQQNVKKAYTKLVEQSKASPRILEEETRW